MDYLTMAAEGGHKTAQVILGNVMLGKSNDRERGFDERRDSLLSALRLWCSAGTNEALYNCGHVYYGGVEALGLGEDRERAKGYFRRAMEGGDRDACYWVGVEEEDVELVRKAAEEVRGLKGGRGS